MVHLRKVSGKCKYIKYNKLNQQATTKSLYKVVPVAVELHIPWFHRMTDPRCAMKMCLCEYWEKMHEHVCENVCEKCLQCMHDA